MEAEPAQGRVYAIGREAREDPNVVTGTFLLNNHYASVLFDTGADKSFVSITFMSLLEVTPTPLELGPRCRTSKWECRKSKDDHP